MLGELRFLARSKEEVGGAKSELPKVDRLALEAEGKTDPTEMIITK